MLVRAAILGHDRAARAAPDAFGPARPRRPRRARGVINKETAMWYFSWILGIGVALGFGIINVMWLESNGRFPNDGEAPADAGSRLP
jgi:cyd operon protein YbgT